MLTFRVGLACLFGMTSVAAISAAEESEVLVTANRISQDVDQAIAATQVITRDQIQASQSRSIDELLRGAAGFAISNSGGQGKLTSFMVRGAEADHLVVLLDGVRLGSATAGTVALQNIPLELIDRIEIVRGPRSSLYGSEAVGAVMQIFTRHGPGASGAQVSVSGGSYGTRQVVAATNVGDEQAWINVEASKNETSGFNACRGSGTLFRGCYTDEPDRDGYAATSLAARAGTKWGAQTSVQASILRSSSDVEYDGSFANQSHLLQQALGAALSHRLNDAAALKLQLGRAWDKSADYVDAAFQSEFLTKRDTASVQLDYTVGQTQWFSGAVDVQRDHVSGTTVYDVTRRRNVGFLAQYVGAFGQWRTEASVRHDDDQQFGQHQTGSAALAYSFSDGLQMLVQYGSAFKAPTFNELYYPLFGNAKLEPERSHSWEVGAKGQLAGGRWRVTLFDTKVSQLIGLDENFVPENIDAARIRGAEAQIQAQLASWQLQFNSTWLRARNTSASAAHGKVLPRRPKLASSLDLQRGIGSWVIGAQLLAEAARFDDAANTERLKPFATLDLRAEWKLRRDWTVQARVANLMNKRYETIAWYNQPGRAVYGTVRYAKQ